MYEVFVFVFWLIHGTKPLSGGSNSTDRNCSIEKSKFFFLLKKNKTTKSNRQCKASASKNKMFDRALDKTYTRGTFVGAEDIDPLDAPRDASRMPSISFYVRDLSLMQFLFFSMDCSQRRVTWNWWIYNVHRRTWCATSMSKINVCLFFDFFCLYCFSPYSRMLQNHQLGSRILFDFFAKLCLNIKI